jgi:hypothetical protein
VGRGSHGSASEQPREASLDRKKAIELVRLVNDESPFLRAARNSKPTNNDAGGNEAELFVGPCDFSNTLPHTDLA